MVYPVKLDNPFFYFLKSLLRLTSASIFFAIYAFKSPTTVDKYNCASSLKIVKTASLVRLNAFF